MTNKMESLYKSFLGEEPPPSTSTFSRSSSISASSAASAAPSSSPPQHSVALSPTSSATISSSSAASSPAPSPSLTQDHETLTFTKTTTRATRAAAPPLPAPAAYAEHICHPLQQKERKVKKWNEDKDDAENEPPQHAHTYIHKQPVHNRGADALTAAPLLLKRIAKVEILNSQLPIKSYFLN